MRLRRQKEELYLSPEEGWPWECWKKSEMRCLLGSLPLSVLSADMILVNALTNGANGVFILIFMLCFSMMDLSEL